jgi:hypothetical protein
MAMPELAFCDVLICCYTAVWGSAIFFFTFLPGSFPKVKPILKKDASVIS